MIPYVERPSPLPLCVLATEECFRELTMGEAHGDDKVWLLEHSTMHSVGFTQAGDR